MSTHTPARSVRAVVSALVLALVGLGVSACSPGSPESDACADFKTYTAASTTSASGGVPAVTIASSLQGDEAARLEASLANFEACTGIDVVHSSSPSLEADLMTGSRPDLAIVPQTGLVRSLAASGALEALSDSVNANIELGWDRSWVQAGSQGGVNYAAPIMASVKSFVWFSPAAFSRAGYKVPNTWKELVALTQRIATDYSAAGATPSASPGATPSASSQPAPGTEAPQDGTQGARGSGVAPWCLGIADGKATGWPATDWLESALLMTRGTGAYDAWATHEVPLDNADAVAALDLVEDLVLADGRVAGGRQATRVTTVDKALKDLVDGRCLMMLGSSSLENYLPEGTVVTDVEGRNGTVVTATATSTGSATRGATPSASAPALVDTGNQVSAFLLPDDEHSGATIVGSDSLVSFVGSPADPKVKEMLMDYLTTTSWAQERVALGGVATANKNVDVSSVKSDVARRASQILQSRESVIRLDASDTMPPGVGEEALWSAMTRWTTGETSSKEALRQAEEAWPSPH